MFQFANGLMQDQTMIFIYSRYNFYPFLIVIMHCRIEQV